MYAIVWFSLMWLLSLLAAYLHGWNAGYKHCARFEAEMRAESGPSEQLP